MMGRRLVDDDSAAATEIGYVFTFLLGLMFLSAFSIWVWDLEVSTQNRWTEEAMEENLLSVGAAVERADEAAREAGVHHALPVLQRHVLERGAAGAEARDATRTGGRARRSLCLRRARVSLRQRRGTRPPPPPARKVRL